MNLAQLQQGVWNRLGVQSSDGVFTAPVVTGFINDALREMATEHDWPWLQASETLHTVAGTSYVTPGESTTAWTGTLGLTITVGSSVTPLDGRTRDELDDMFQTTAQSQPQVFAIFGDVLELRPIPDAVYTLTHRYVRSERVLASGQSPLLPDAYCPAVCDLAAVLCLGRSKDDSRAVAAERRYDGWLSKMMDNMRRDRRPGRIRVRAGSQI